MKRSVLFVTGPDTGAGKTVVACLLTRHLRAAGVSVAALKPVCSGGRGDARALRAASDGALPLDAINPWHFRAALAPSLAARREKRRLTLNQVTAHVRGVQRRFPVVIVEGAGGLLSPLGHDFDSRDLIRSLRATPIVTCWNRLGAISQALLVLAALPRHLRRRAQIVLISPDRSDASSRSNRQVLAGMLAANRVHVLPWLKSAGQHGGGLRHEAVRRTLSKLVRRVLGTSAPLL